MKIKQSIVSAICITIIAFLALVPIISSLDTDNFANCPATGFGGMMGGGYGSGFMILGWITYLAVLALIIAGIYWLIKSANKRK